MSIILYGMINKRAEATYTGPAITAKNYELWIAHWFKCAYEIEEEFYNEGLTNTANAIRVIVRDNAGILEKH